ncbi:MAG: ribbon-helix-helix protein, CopG family [Deltaproteobacteria bacterium]|nr:ribbon-helix-helix protein, CopG family [Deltaproteobacteria bacterium]
MENIVTSLSLPRDMEEKLREFARLRGQTKSRLIQEALRDYLQRKEIEPIEQKMQAKARAMGIESDDDVVALIHKVRHQTRK